MLPRLEELHLEVVQRRNGGRQDLPPSLQEKKSDNSRSPSSKRALILITSSSGTSVGLAKMNGATSRFSCILPHYPVEARWETDPLH
jgi:hypothetical protein